MLSLSTEQKSLDCEGGQHEISGLHNYTVCLHICTSQAVQMDW